MRSLQHSPLFIYRCCWFCFSFFCSFIVFICTIIKHDAILRHQKFWSVLNFPFRSHNSHRRHALVCLHRFDFKLSIPFGFACDLVTIQVSAVIISPQSEFERTARQKVAARNEYKFNGPTFVLNQFTLVPWRIRISLWSVAIENTNRYCFDCEHFCSYRL